MNDIYKQAEERMTGRGKTSGGGSGQDFWKIAKPSQIGQILEYRFRLVQRLAMAADGQQETPARPLSEFWLVVDQHGFPGRAVGSDQKWVSVNCPDTALHEESNWRKRITCPICLLQNELWQLHDDAYKKVTDLLRWKTRVFANVIDLDDPRSHWKQLQVEGQGQQWQVRPKIYAFSKTTFLTFIGFCREYGAIEDWKNGRALKMTITKDGPQDMDIKYQFFSSDPSPVDQQLMPVVMGATDLAYLAKPTAMDELQKIASLIDPRAGGAVSAAPGSYGGQALPPQTGGYQPAPPTPHHPAGNPGVTYHYNDGNGSYEGKTAADVAAGIAGNPSGQHMVWAPGWPQWTDARGVQDIAQAQAAMRPAQPQAPSGAPPAMPGGPPQPPQPSGMPHNMPSPNPPTTGGQSGYTPQGGYPQPPTQPTGVNAPGNAHSGPPMPGVTQGGPPSF